MKKFIIGLVVVVLIGLGIYYFNHDSNAIVQTPPVVTTGDTSSTMPQTQPVSVVTQPATTPENQNKYKDGTYTATGTYQSPAGTEHIQVSVTLANDIITDATVTANEPDSPTSQREQGMFVSNFKQYVIGKNIEDVTLTRVSGSSLTPMGWNNAISQIEREAQA